MQGNANELGVVWSSLKLRTNEEGLQGTINVNTIERQHLDCIFQGCDFFK
jgi:hypothetical protein